MTDITADKSQLKEMLKTALVEIIKEDKEIFYDLLTEVIEDIAMSNAIKEGENTELVSRETIFNKLKRQPGG